MSFEPTTFFRRQVLAADLFAVVAGMITVLAFAPYSFAPSAVLGPTLLFASWEMADSYRRLVWRGYLYGLGLFGLGVSWIYHSLRLFGAALAPLAAPLTILFIALIALVFVAMAMAAGVFRNQSRPFRLLIVWPAIWVLFEWLRSWLFTGFPWLLLGDSQVGSAPGGLAPLVGTLGVSWLLIFLGGCLLLALLVRRLWHKGVLVLLVLVLWSAAGALRGIQWTRPAGSEFRVSLIQGDIPQQRKFNPQALNETLTRYYSMTRQQWQSRLIVWPETAVPLLYREVASNFLAPLAARARQHNDTILTGIFRQQGGKVYNAVVSLGEGKPEFYEKHHLVPFGEYMPMRHGLGWLYRRMNVPMANLSPGRGSYVLMAAGIPVGISICYEIAFGAETLHALPKAELLVNVSNDAWFGDSLEPAQQLQMARMRALETGRYLLAATNSGISAVISPAGRILARGEWGQVVSVNAMVRPMRGSTLYVHTGNRLIVGLAFLVLFLAVLMLIFPRETHSEANPSRD